MVRGRDHSSLHAVPLPVTAITAFRWHVPFLCPYGPRGGKNIQRLVVLGTSAPLVASFKFAYPSVNSPFINFFSVRHFEVCHLFPARVLADNVIKLSFHLGLKLVGVTCLPRFSNKYLQLTVCSWASRWALLNRVTNCWCCIFPTFFEGVLIC